MNDELPEPLSRLSPPDAPPGLRQRTLAAVDRELAGRRKPRWERLLELSVAATFVLGIGLNARLVHSGIELLVMGAPQHLRDLDQPGMVAQDQDAAPDATGPASIGSAYARYLSQLTDKTAG